MNSPTVTVITAAYNAASFIRESIESILHQTFTQFEYIIIDNASIDQTWAVIQSFRGKDPRIVAIRNETNLGIAGNRNKALTFAKGEFIVWQDADDISLPTRIERQLRYMRERPDVGIVGGFLQVFNKHGDQGIRRYFEHDHDLRKRIFMYSPVAQPAAMIRRECFSRVGVYDTKLGPADDIEMSFRIGSKYKFANLQEIVLRYRVHTNSATFTSLKNMELGTITARKKYSHSAAYRMTWFDRVYNTLHYLSIYLVPPKFKIAIFNIFRN